MLYAQLLLFNHSVISDSLRRYGVQHARLPCPSLSSWSGSNSCPLSKWCHSTISPSGIPFSSCLQSLPASGSFHESVLHIRWPKYWSVNFSISPSNEYSGLVSSRIDWFDLLADQGALKSLPQRYNWKASVLQCSAFFMVQLSHPYMTTEKTIALTRQTCQYRRCRRPGSISGSGTPPGKGNGNVYGVTKSKTQLSMHNNTCMCQLYLNKLKYK